MAYFVYFVTVSWWPPKSVTVRKIDGRKMSREANAMDHFSAINLSALQNQPCPSERVAPGLCHQPGLIQQRIIEGTLSTGWSPNR